MSDVYYVTDDELRCSAKAQDVISAYDYISGSSASLLPGAKFINACLDRSYLSIGYYVGLLAEARGHSPGDVVRAARAWKKAPKYPVAPGMMGPKVGVLYSPDLPFNPSHADAIHRFEVAARKNGLDAIIVPPLRLDAVDDLDALFIRSFTSPGNASFQFADRAAHLGLPVIDDPVSILRCANKVFINEICLKYGIATPKTLVVTPQMSFDFIAGRLGIPFVLKVPDGAFSRDVYKVESRQTAAILLDKLRKRSAVLCAQEFVPTDFDWRVTTLDGKALFVCKYFMVEGHWQISKHHEEGCLDGHGIAIPLKECPDALLKFAERVSGLVGSGLYGIDIKECDGRYQLIEINDNPNIEELEASIAEDAVWDKIAGYFAGKIAADIPFAPIGPDTDDILHHQDRQHDHRCL